VPSNEFFTHVKWLHSLLATRHSLLNMKLSDLKKGDKATILRIRDGCIKNNKKFIVIRASEAQEIAIAIA